MSWVLFRTMFVFRHDRGNCPAAGSGIIGQGCVRSSVDAGTMTGNEQQSQLSLDPECLQYNTVSNLDASANRLAPTACQG